jgi:hypothetical protein
VGRAGKENGELLALAAANFDVFVTVDRNLSFQQSSQNLKIGVIVLIARGNRLVDLLPLVSMLRDAVETVGRGEVVGLSGRGDR